MAETITAATERERAEKSGTGAIVASHLRQLVERIERLEEEKKALSDDIREVYAEAKGHGFDTKTMRAVIKRRKQERSDLQEQDAMLALYLDALGELPLFPTSH